MKDSRIIKLFIKRSEDAITELSKKYKIYMYSISHNILRNNEDVEECINDAFLSVWSNIPPIIPQSLKAYSAKIIRNLSIDRYRKINADKRGNGQIEVVFDELEEILRSNNIVEDTIISKELITEINLYLGLISDEKRLMFVLRYYYAYSIKDVSKKMNISESKVKTSLYRLRSDLKEHLTERGITIWGKVKDCLEN